MVGIDEQIANANKLLDKGKWSEAKIAFDNAAIEAVRQVSALNGWALWKQGEKKYAAECWQKVLDPTKAPDMVNSTAYSGLTLYMADQNNQIARNYATLSIAMIPDGEEDQDHATRANTCAIALAQLGDFEAAEKILRKTMKMNEYFESSKKNEIAKTGIHQRAKNGYNLSSWILIPQGKYVEARNELFDQVMPRYQAVGAISDLAAVFFRVGLTYEKEKDYPNALKQYEKCLKIWTEVGDENRIRQAQENVDRVIESVRKSAMIS